MKTRSSYGNFRPAVAGLAVVTAALVLVLGLAACDGETKKSKPQTRKPAGSPPAKTTVKNTGTKDIWLVKDPLPRTPKQLFSLLKKAAREDDLKKMSGYLDQITRDMIRYRRKAALKSLQKHYDEGAITRDRYHEKRLQIEASGLPRDYLGFGSMQAEDPVYRDKAHTRCTVLLYRPAENGKRDTMTIHMVKSGSLWRLDLLTELRLADARKKNSTP